MGAMQFSPGTSPLARRERFIRDQALGQVIRTQAAMKNIVMCGWLLDGGHKARPDPVRFTHKWILARCILIQHF